MICETQMPPMMTNSKDSQGHKDKYLNTGRKIVLLDNEAVWGCSQNLFIR